jgi:alkylglycerol monooxygenase
MINPIVYAVPVFLLLMVGEYALSRRRAQPVYRAADTVSSLSLGVISQLVGGFTKLLALGLYTLVYEHAALLRLPADSPWVWLGALLAYDFCYYWLHRLGHEVHLLWAAHGVHHSSEDYNLGTALRQTGTGFLFGWLFYLPMALAGVPPLVFAVVGLVDLLYQFWVHTQLVGRLGWFDRVFVSPSNHRVHHGQNDYCIDRNYGGILILWDRLFGTFAQERDDEPVVYGIRGALRSWNPLWANLHGYAQIAKGVAAAPRWADKLRLPFKPPGWVPAGTAGVSAKAGWDAARFERYEPPLPLTLATHALLQLAVLLAFSLHFLLVAPQTSLVLGAGYAVVLVLQLAALAGLTTRGSAAFGSEAARWLVGAVLLALSPLHGPAWLVLWLVSGLAGSWAFARARQAAVQPLPVKAPDSAVG